MDTPKLLTVKTNKTPIKEVKPIEITNKIIKESLKNIDKTNQTDNKTLQYIANKKSYKTFLKLVRENKFTTGIIAAEICGVSRQTIAEWIKTPLVKQTMNKTINDYVSTIAVNKDWKAQAYLLDKLQGNKDNITNIQVNTLDGLTIIRR